MTVFFISPTTVFYFPADSNQANQDKRRSTMTAKLDVWSMKQLIVLIARFAGFNSVNLAFTEEAEFVTLWDVNQFGDGVWSFWNSKAEDGCECEFSLLALCSYHTYETNDVIQS